MNWKVGDEFEVEMNEGDVARGRLTHTPSHGGYFAARSLTKSGRDIGPWSFSTIDEFYQLARPVQLTHTYKPGDRIRYITTVGSIIKQNDIGEYIAHNRDDIHECRFNGTVFYVTSDQIEPYTSPRDTSPLPCVLCDTFYPMAEPNLPDGKLACWSCRTYRAYSLRTYLTVK